MHIAVCIDHAANRKQMERLLNRIGGKMPAEKVLYIDSYGSVSAVMGKHKLYDLFLVDMTEGEEDGLSLALRLKDAGVTAPIVLCPSSIDYKSQIDKSEDASAPKTASFLFLQQPVKTDELEEIIHYAFECLTHVVQTIELRSEQNTVYATEDEILYALQKADKVQVFLTDDRCVTLISNIRKVYNDMSIFSHIHFLSDQGLTNELYIRSFGFSSVTLKNGVQIRTPHHIVKTLKSKINFD